MLRGKKELLFVWSRNNCDMILINKKPQYIKKLSKVWFNRSYKSNRKNTIIIDDSSLIFPNKSVSYAKNINNGINIMAFMGDNSDIELHKIRLILESL